MLTIAFDSPVPCFRGLGMPERHRIKQELGLNDRLKIFSDQLKAQASRAPPGPERDDLLKRARITDTAAHIDQWANSPGLKPPK